MKPAKKSKTVVGGLILVAAAVLGGMELQNQSNEATPAAIAAEPASSAGDCSDLCQCQAKEIAALKARLAAWEDYGRKMEAYLGRKQTVSKPKATAKATYQGGNCANGQCSMPRRGLFGRR